MSVKTETYFKDKQLTASFKLSEFLCKSGTKTVKYSPELVKLLQEVINKSGKIVSCRIVSGYRTPEYSVKVGGTKGDAHTVGIAADVQFKDADKKIIPIKYIACFAQDMGFGGIGVMGNSIHLDVRHLGGYANKKWWGDETKNYSLSKNGKDFYKYYGLTRSEVYSYLKIGQAASEKEEQPTPKETVVSLKEEPQEQATPIIEGLVVEEALPEVVNEIETNAEIEPTEKSPDAVEPIQTEAGAADYITEADSEPKNPSGILEALRYLLLLIFEWVRGENNGK